MADERERVPVSSGPGSTDSSSTDPGAGGAEADTGGAGTAASVASDAEEPAPGGRVLRGITVAPGLTLGRVHRKDYDLDRAGSERVALGEVDRELNRFRRSLDDSRAQLADLKTKLVGRVPEEDARILDTHVTYLKDSVFIADVENLILNEQMRLEVAIAKVVADFDRIFRLVKNDTLRQSAVDLRDVAIRVLRNLEQTDPPAERPAEPPKGEYILVAKELSIVDMFNLENQRVLGIATRAGGLTSHAAIFARSMRIPTLTGVEGLLEEAQENDFVILDATEGLLRIEPDPVVRAQYARSVHELEEMPERTGEREVPDWARRAAETTDGISVELLASCGNLPEVEHAADLAMGAIGLYRTELLYLVEKNPPSRDGLTQHYASVLAAANGAPVTFRLLNVDSSLGLPYLHPERERNPALGQQGVRALLANERVLRRQLQALLLAAGEQHALRLAVPFVVDCSELRRVREILFEERLELRNAGETFAQEAQIGVVIETPAALFGLRDLALEADFLLLNLDSLQQYLLAADRERADDSPAFDAIHPFVLRALRKLCEVTEGQDRPVDVFGSSVHADNLPTLIGAGLRRFCVPPLELRTFLDAVVQLKARDAGLAVRKLEQQSVPSETASWVASFRQA